MTSTTMYNCNLCDSTILETNGVAISVKGGVSAAVWKNSPTHLCNRCVFGIKKLLIAGEEIEEKPQVSSNGNGRTPVEYSEIFLHWWAVWPEAKRANKKAAYEKYELCLNADISHATLHSHLTEYVAAGDLSLSPIVWLKHRLNPPKKKRQVKQITSEQLYYPVGMTGPEVRQAMAEWLTHHKSIGKPYKSVDAVNRLLLDTTPEAFVDAVNNSIKNNYQGLFGSGQGGTAPVDQLSGIRDWQAEKDVFPNTNQEQPNGTQRVLEVDGSVSSGNEEASF